MTNTFDTHRTKVDRQHIKGGFSAALDDRRQAPGKGIRAMRLHGIDHHRPGAAAAERLHQGGGQGIDKAVIEHENNAR